MQYGLSEEQAFAVADNRVSLLSAIRDRIPSTPSKRIQEIVREASQPRDAAAIGSGAQSNRGTALRSSVRSVSRYSEHQPRRWLVGLRG